MPVANSGSHAVHGGSAGGMVHGGSAGGMHCSSVTRESSSLYLDVLIAVFDLAHVQAGHAGS